MSFLRISDIHKKGEDGFALSGISFHQARLERIAIAGETGAGKSTLLKIIAGLVQPDAGEVWFRNGKVRGPAEQLVPGHPEIGFLSQQFELQKSLRVEQVLAYSTALPARTANRLFEVCQISHLLRRRTDHLSGGEKQRIAICRLLVASPKLVLLDEPYAHLDLEHKSTLRTVIGDIGQKLKITCIIVSHDPRDTLSWADKMIVMKDGRLVQQGSPETIYREPVDIYTGGLFGKYNLIRPDMVRAFSVLPAIRRAALKAGKRNIFIRPEQFRVSTKKSGGLKGKVRDISFFGPYCEFDISVAGHTVVARSYTSKVSPGDVVYLSLMRGPLWLL